eukprot:TRINITY_DN2545_c0_g1_i2.p1 TRINITY_DN2545_c0_g1~~TRINITY_DN2545_c0_g1_i2.p1  ORF type:complete len:678 (+),score=136.13 TRINITY_DN2545_c0_g1_i2:131-2164(+)
MRRSGSGGGGAVGAPRNRVMIALVFFSLFSLVAITITSRSIKTQGGEFQWPPRMPTDAKQHGKEPRANTNSTLHYLSTAVVPEYNGPFEPNEKIIILAWDGGQPFGWGYGKHIPMPNYVGYDYTKEDCPVECVWTTDRDKLPEADAILFDPCATGPREWREVPVHMPDKQAGQRWGWFTYEQYVYFPMMKNKEYMSLFDYKMTYHHDALTQITFICPWGGIDGWLDPPPPKTNDKLIMFAASNCHTGGADRRTAYVQELMQYIDVHSYGACLHNMEGFKEQSHGNKMPEKIRQAGQYKFVLAFENQNEVDEYVTEKIANAFQAGVVPVYWGAPTIDLWLPGPHSVINARDYKSPKELADYLRYLSENDDEYYKYFEWKKNGLSKSFQRLLDNCFIGAECRLCKQMSRLRKADGGYTRPKFLPEHGQYGHALLFNDLSTKPNAYDDYVNVPHHASLSVSDSFTLMAWIKPNHILDGRIIDKNNAGEVNGLGFDVWKVGGDGGLLRLCGGGNCRASTRRIHLGIWYHVAVTYEMNGPDAGINFYINGKHDSKHPATQPIQTNTLPVRFGRAAEGGRSWRWAHASSVYDGLIDDPSIWKRALSKKEIKDYMFLRPEGTEDGLVGWWDFNEGKGTQVKDRSVHQNHGSFSGNPQWVVSNSKPLVDPSNQEYDDMITDTDED